MILVDANVLLYALDSEASRHEQARQWLERILAGSETVALPWLTLLAVLRIGTSSRVLRDPWPVGDLLDEIDRWLAQPCVVVVHPGSRHSGLLRELLGPFGVGGNLVSDAHLAALAVEHGAEVHSCDHDFGRFSGVRWTDPLAA